MSKKKHGKKHKRGTESGYAPDGWGTPYGAAAGYPPADGNGRIDGGLLHGLLGSRQTEQFVLGALLGAAAVYVLGDEKLRNKLIKAGLNLYSGIAGNFEEMKEQMADLQAEAQAERNSAP